MKNKNKILGAMSFLALLIVTLSLLSPSKESTFLSQQSMRELKQLNKTHQISLQPLGESDVKLHKQLLMAGLLESDNETKEKGLIASLKGDKGGIFLLQPDQPLSDRALEDLAQQYAQIPELEFVEVDQSLKLMEDDSLLAPTIASEEEIASAASEKINKPVRIGVFDSGIDAHHPIFSKTLIGEGWDGIQNEAYREGDEVGHGTHVAGIIAMQSPKAEIIPYKVASKEGGKLSNLIAALQKCLDEGNLDLINMSFGFSEPSDILEKMIKTASEQGIIMVAAAGNKHSEAAFYPAYYPEVIAVGSATRSGRTLETSNYGSWVDVAGLGHYVHSAAPEGGYSYKSGTSQATAFVSAYISHLLEQNGAEMKMDTVLDQLHQAQAKVQEGGLKGLTLIE